MYLVRFLVVVVLQAEVLLVFMPVFVIIKRLICIAFITLIT